LRQLDDFHHHLEGSTDSNAQGTVDQGVVYRFLFSGKCLRVITIRDLERSREDIRKRKSLPRERVLGRNTRYHFDIRRKAEHDPYLLRYGGKQGGEPFETIKAKYMFSVFAPFCVNFKPLPEWFETPGFAVQSVAPVTREGKTYAQLRARYVTNKETVEDGDAGFEGSLLLDPERYWCICEVNNKVHFRIRGDEYDVPWQTVVNYGPPLKGMPVAHTVTHRIGGPPSKRALTNETWTIRDLVHRKAPETEFTVSAFGLPEIFDDAPSQPKSHLGLYLLSLGAALGIVTVIVVWQRHKARPRADAAG
jgi:hypothetical protein